MTKLVNCPVCRAVRRTLRVVAGGNNSQHFSWVPCHYCVGHGVVVAPTKEAR